MKPPIYIYRAIVKECSDGDTVLVDVDLGLGVWAHDVSLRLLDVWAPEKTGVEKPLGLLARDALLKILAPGLEILVKTDKPKKNPKKDLKDKYGRYVATLYLITPDDGTETVNEAITKQILAITGGKPTKNQPVPRK